MNKGSHYEQAFQNYLEYHRIPHVALDQTQKAAFAGVKIKSFDLLIYPPTGPRLLVDVKGRKCSLKRFRSGRFGETWTTTDDLEGLQAWLRVFGAGYQAFFIFAYWLFDAEAPEPAESLHHHEMRDYFFMAVELDAYRRRARPRSQTWKTVYLPVADFTQVARPFSRIAGIPT